MIKVNNGILVTGCHRSGTSLMTSLMLSLSDVFVNQSEKEPHLRVTNIENSKKYFVRKCPQLRGCATINDVVEDFGPYSIHDIIQMGYKVIYMLRDGRDVEVSRHPKQPNKYWSEPWKWVESVRRGLPNFDNPDLMVVKYEQFVAAPDSIMDSIAKWLDLGREDINNVHSKVMSKSEIGIAMGTPRPVDSNSVGRWKQPEHAERIKAVLEYPRFKELLIETGYIDG